MNFNRVWAIVVRHLYNFRHSLDRMSDVFYWPAMNILLWGFTSVFISQFGDNLSFIVLTLISGIIFWLIVWKGSAEISVNLLEEMWNQNMMNLFASPLRLREWIAGVFILSIINLFVSVSFSALLALVIYKTNIFTIGFYLIPFMVSLLISGWAMGLLISGAIIRYGTRIQTLAWTGVTLLAPFSGVYYPVSILPSWAQNIALFLPTSYIFEGMRSVVFTGSLPWDMLVKSFILNILLLALGMWFFAFMFEKSRVRGLSRLE
jgi:ABC-2 type transport system permease protein